MCWKWFPSARRHVSCVTDTLLMHVKVLYVSLIPVHSGAFRTSEVWGLLLYSLRHPTSKTYTLCDLATKSSLRSIVTKTVSINCAHNSVKTILCVISGFRREVAENCALLAYYRASIRSFLQTFRGNRWVPYSGFKKTLDTEDGTTGCPETSVRNYHYSLRNNPEERISQDHTTVAHMMSQCVRSRKKKMFVVILLGFWTCEAF
jgi:hypothetical protein